MMKIPNIIADDVPIGEDDTHNVVQKKNQNLIKALTI